jgi:hypothetical protein
MAESGSLHSLEYVKLLPAEAARLSKGGGARQDPKVRLLLALHGIETTLAAARHVPEISDNSPALEV